jgi:5-methylthioadenosine/S-adenosylhomocysteine deaminase
MDDPEALVKAAEQRRNAFAGPLDASEAPLMLFLDMPHGRGAVAGRPKRFDEVRFDPLPSLVHDETFFDSITGTAFHGGVLDGLRSWW